MAESISSPTIVRTDRGLSIAGTRITLYDIIAYLKANWPPTLIGHWFNLSDDQMSAIIAYIAEHQNEVEAEYQTVLAQADAIHEYWEERNRLVEQHLKDLLLKPEQAEVATRLRTRKKELGLV